MNIPGYRIEQEIGRGGMATVYRAVQESLQRTVAVKVMSAALAVEAGFGERFLREARTAASLSHPNILSVHDVGVVNHNYYLVMEYISDGDLKQRIRHGIAPADALTVIKQIATALGHAHGEGFVHRDVKPENILFRKDGTAVLADFGIAKAIGSGTRMTGTGMSIGTPHYMSPEQVRGKDVDGRSDLYSLGVVLFEALTSTLPFDSDDAFAIAYSHINDPVPQLPDMLKELQPLMEKLLAKNQKQRHETSTSLCQYIDTLLSRHQWPTYAKGRSVSEQEDTTNQQTVVNRQIQFTASQHSAQRFIDNDNVTVIDTMTGLVWQKEDDGIERTWKEAIDYANQLELGGSCEWRLPVVEELKLLVDVSTKPTISSIFVGTKASDYWTSSTGVGRKDHAQSVDFFYGNVCSYNKMNKGYVRCVWSSYIDSQKGMEGT